MSPSRRSSTRTGLGHARRHRLPFRTASGELIFSGLSLYAAMFLLSLYYQEVRGQDAQAAGLLLAPQGLGALLSRPVGPVVDKIGARRIVLAGICLCALGRAGWYYAPTVLDGLTEVSTPCASQSSSASPTA